MQKNKNANIRTAVSLKFMNFGNRHISQFRKQVVPRLPIHNFLLILECDAIIRLNCKIRSPTFWDLEQPVSETCLEILADDVIRIRQN